MSLTYRSDALVSAEQFVGVLERSGLAARRPVGDPVCIAGMLANADLVVTAWQDETLIGVARSVTDFHYACYLSDLAVDAVWQRSGVGRALVELTRRSLAPTCSVILLAAPAAVQYYPRIGFEQHPSAWILAGDPSV